jgi:hypothetical protein
MAKGFLSAFSAFGTLATLCGGLYAADAPVGVSGASCSTLTDARSESASWIDGIMEHVKLTIGSCLTEKIEGEWLCVIGVINPQESKFDDAAICERYRTEGWGDFKRQFMRIFLGAQRDVTTRKDVPVTINGQTEKITVTVWKPQEGGGIPVIAISDEDVTRWDACRGLSGLARNPLLCANFVPNNWIVSSIPQNVLNAVRACITEKTQERLLFLAGIVGPGSYSVDSAMFVEENRWESWGDNRALDAAFQVNSGDTIEVADILLDENSDKTIAIARYRALDNGAIPVISAEDLEGMKRAFSVLLPR